MSVIKLARDLGSEIQKQETYLKMVESQKKNDADSDLQQLIGEFNLKRIALDSEMKKETKDKEKIESTDNEVRILYQKIMANPNMLEYNKNRQQLTMLLNDINKILSAAVSGQDPQTLDLEEKPGCNGSCGSCGGCH